MNSYLFGRFCICFVKVELSSLINIDLDFFGLLFFKIEIVIVVLFWLVLKRVNLEVGI